MVVDDTARTRTTSLVQVWEPAEPNATGGLEGLIPLVYDELRALAHLLATRWSSETLFSLRTDPLLTRIRSDSRYADLLRSLALTP